MWKLRIKTRSHQNQYHFEKCHIAHKTVDLKFHVSNLTSLEYVFGIAIEIVPAQGFHKHVTSFLTRCIWMYMNITSAVTLAEMRIIYAAGGGKRGRRWWVGLMLAANTTHKYTDVFALLFDQTRWRAHKQIRRERIHMHEGASQCGCCSPKGVTREWFRHHMHLPPVARKAAFDLNNLGLMFFIIPCRRTLFSAQGE